MKKADTPNNFGDKGFLGFEHVTLVCSLLSFSFMLLGDRLTLSSVSHAQEANRYIPFDCEGKRMVGFVP